MITLSAMPQSWKRFDLALQGGISRIPVYERSRGDELLVFLC